MKIQPKGFDRNYRGDPEAKEAAGLVRAAQPGRQAHELFTIACRAYHAEADAIGRAPSFRVGRFGLALGIEQGVIEVLSAAARNHVEQQRRVAIKGHSIGTGLTRRWVVNREIVKR